MKIKLTHKQTGDVVLVDNTNATENNDIKIESSNPILLVAFIDALKIATTFPELVPESLKPYINPETGALDTYTDEYLENIFIDKYDDFYDIEIVE